MCVLLLNLCYMSFFFFKQKTAYEMRISDWSSDVCSSDLVDIVKIDGSFVRGVSDNPENQLFIRTLLNLANGFGLKTVAECVETAEDARILMSERVEFLQGWHYARPSMRKPWMASRLLARQPAFGAGCPVARAIFSAPLRELWCRSP